MPNPSRFIQTNPLASSVATLKGEHAATLAKRDAEHRAEIVALEAKHRSAIDGALSALHQNMTAEFNAKLAAAVRPASRLELDAMQAALDKTAKERDDARRFDVRLSGSAHSIPLTRTLGEPNEEHFDGMPEGATDQEKWDRYSEIAAKNPRAASRWKKLHLARP